jgi:hypothetical protein
MTSALTTPRRPWSRPACLAGAAVADHDDGAEAEQRDRAEAGDRPDRRATVAGARPEEGAVHGALRGAHPDRHLPVEDLGAPALVRHLLRRDGAHPVDAVVVPLEAPGAVDDLPVRRGAGLRVRGHRTRARAVAVEVERGRVTVDLDRAVAEQSRVRLALVALHDDGLAGRVLQLEAVVEVEHLQAQAGDLRRDPVDDRAVVGIALVGDGGRRDGEREERRQRRDCAQAEHRFS